MRIFLVSIFISILGIVNLVGVRPEFALRQSIFLVLGIIVFFTARYLKVLIRFSLPFLFWGAVALNILVIFFGREIKGARRWFQIAGINLQPSEILLVVFIFYLAHILSSEEIDFSSLWVFIKAGFIALAAFLAIYFQPDFTTAVNILPIFFFQIIFSRINKKFLLTLFIAFSLIAPMTWFSLKDYQRDRILSFIGKGEINPQVFYNMKQAEITLGSGGFFGKGLGKSTQAKLFFLPESHTDFAFASFIEQTGFFGGVFLLFLYFIFLFFLLMQIIREFSKKRWGSYKILSLVGFMGYFIYRLTMNIGMNLNLLPIAGIPLPFFSYGGSSLLALLLGMGMLEF